jgi:hypothetical protein
MSAGTATLETMRKAGKYEGNRKRSNEKEDTMDIASLPRVWRQKNDARDRLRLPSRST